MKVSARATTPGASGVFGFGSAGHGEELTQLLRGRVTAYLLITMAQWTLFLGTNALISGRMQECMVRTAGTECGGELELIIAGSTLLVLGVVALLITRRRVGNFVLGTIEMAVTFALTVAVAYLAARGDPARRPELSATLALTNTLILRAALVPNMPARTALVGAISTVIVLTGSYLVHRTRVRVLPEPVALLGIAAFWCTVAVIGTTAVSSLIYGLRQRVAEALRLGQYTLEHQIGEGGMGIVYRARHALLRRPTAIKMLAPELADDGSLARFEREVQLTAELSHPNTIAIYDYGRTPDGTFYYAMEYLDGENLEDLVRATGPLPESRVIYLMRQAAGALAEAHDAGLIHRDVKPANIVVCSRGGTSDFVKVVDFGLVRDLRSSAVHQSSDAMLTGTPLYMAPEQIRDPGAVDARVDLYALGGVMYFLLTGRPVFERKSMIEVFGDHLHTDPEPPSHRADRALDPDLEALVMRCLEKDPAARPASARELIELLDASALRAWTSEDAASWWAEHGEQLRATRARQHRPAHKTMAVNLARRGPREMDESR